MGNCESNLNSNKLSTKRTFFSVEKEERNEFDTFQNMKTKVKLEFTIEGIETNHKYSINAFFADKQNDIFTTEKVNSHSNIITFNTCYICDYYFERIQYIKIALMKDFSVEGTISATLGSIVGSPNSCFKKQINNSINIIITAQGLRNANSFVDVCLYAKNSFYNFRINSNKISYLIISNGRKIYSSESISDFGKFDIAKIPAALLQDGFTVLFLNSSQKTIGSRNDTIQTFTQGKGDIYLHLSAKGKNILIGNKSKLIKNINFIDYIRNGVTIKLTIGIDYTSSNKSPDDPMSLHFLGGNMNDYEQAIKACGMVVAYYDYNQLFPVYGFGAVIKGQQKPNMCFNVNMKENPEIFTIDNVIKEYQNSFQYLILAGPTNFCPLIKRAIATIKIENDPLKYHILLILTDGIIYDMEETVEALVDASFLPLSVIIIGIGNDHFKEMIELDGDDNPLTNKRGVKRMRDIVQFVPFNKYKYDPNELAAQVLEEVPRQIIEYYSAYKIDPENLQQARINSPAFNNSSIYPSNINSAPQFGYQRNNMYIAN